MSSSAASRLVGRWTELHDGVWLAAYGTPTKMQRCRAATLTAPRTVLSHFSAADYHGIREHRGSIQSVTRPGSGGVKQRDHLRIHHSRTLNGNVTKPHGFWVTTVERTIIDHAPALPEPARRKLVREALRLRKTTCAAMLAASGGQRGTAALNALVSRYQRLQLERCRSDAEAFAMEVLEEAGVPLPQVNQDVAGEEADLSWPGRIIEIDGPGYHVLTDEDARKTEAWTRAGNTVDRIPSDTLFANPHELIALATLDSQHRA
jgi:hypothetical protein